MCTGISTTHFLNANICFLFENLTIGNADVVMLSIKNMEGKQMEGNEGQLEIVQQ